MCMHRYLTAMTQPETLAAFKERMEGAELDEAAIKAAIQQDKAREVQQRATGISRPKV